MLEDWQDYSAFTPAMLHCEILNRLRHEKPERRRDVKKFEFRRTPIHVFSTCDPKAGSVELCARVNPIDHSAALPTTSRVPNSDQAGSEVQQSTEREINEDEQAISSTSEISSPYGRTMLTKVDSSGDTLLPHVLISLALEEEQLLDLEECRKWLQQFPALAKYAKVEGVYKSNSTLLILSIPVVIWDGLPNNIACAFIGYVHSVNIMGLERGNPMMALEAFQPRNPNHNHAPAVEIGMPPNTIMPSISNRLVAAESRYVSSISSVTPSLPSGNTLSSSSSRSKQRLQAQNKLPAARPLLPKDMSEGLAMSRDNSPLLMSRLEPTAKLQGKSTIYNYQRPSHDPVFCPQCDDNPNGFRGEHELRRHQNRTHMLLVKKWVCVQPNDNADHPTPTVPLASCKACKNQKAYGAYYNAAAHLRRAHFRPKDYNRGSKLVAGSQKRGGKAGGDWPPMTELKLWMIEREVNESAEGLLTTSSKQAVDEAAEYGDSDNELYPVSSLAQHRELEGAFNTSRAHLSVRERDNPSPYDLSIPAMYEPPTTFSVHRGPNSSISDDMSNMHLEGQLNFRDIFEF